MHDGGTSLSEKSAARPLDFSQRDLLRALYLGRMTLVAGILVAVLFSWLDAQPSDTRIATLVFLAALAMTTWSFWRTHVRDRDPSQNFLYVHVVFDVAVVTAIVHITASAGADSPFVPAYILAISEGALLLPLPGGVLIGALASIVYFADVVWAQSGTVSPAITLQIGLFALVAVVTGWVGDRVRRTGLALGQIRSELQDLRLSTGDILGHISTGVMTVDSTGRLVYMNRAGEALLGLRFSEWESAPVLDLVEANAPGMGAVLKRGLEDRRSTDRFKTVAHFGNRHKTLGVSTTIVELGDGDSPSVTAIFQDITDLERLAGLNRRNQRLEAVAELSASLAHEIKNPLASIRSAVEQITKPRILLEDRKVLEHLIVGESDRLSRLLSEFLDFSAISPGPAEDVDMARSVEKAIAVVRQHPAADGGIRIEAVRPEGLSWIPGDADLLHRLVFNLLLNAVQFSPPEGVIRVELKHCTRPGLPRGLHFDHAVRLSVEDSGPGIEPGQAERIFDPFYTTRKGGSGLGLAVVHRAVEAHGGVAFVEASSLGGARFVIYLPGAERAVAAEGGAA